MKQALFIGAIASILTINSVLADTVVTSRNYVDTQDALKQDKITAGTTGSVVTYNGAQNGQTQFSERGIFNPETDFDFNNNEVATGHEGDLVTADIYPAVGHMYNQVGDIYNQINVLGAQIQQATNNLPETTVTYKTCVGWNSEFHTDNNCILWNLSDAKVYGKCNTNNDCPGVCDFCNNGTCVTDNEHCVS